MKDLSKLFATELSKKKALVQSKIEAVKEELTTIETTKTLKKNGQLSRSAPVGVLEDVVMAEEKQQPKTLLQLSAIPLAINIDLYKNPHSGDNPTGDYKSAYRFSLLADSIPLLEPQFDQSMNSVEKIWGNLIYGATSMSSYTQHLLQEAQSTYDSSGLSGMGGVPDTWYPVYAKPSDWYTIVEDESNLIEIEIDMHDGEALDNEFITLNGNNSLSWSATNANDDKDAIALHANTDIKKIKLKVLQVDFVRPWLDFEIFNLKNWKVSGIGKEYFSNGKIENNKGVFPLITQTMLVGAKVSVEGDFDDSDVNVIQTSKSKNLSIGPFLLNTTDETARIEKQDENMVVTSNVKQIVGYISKLIPAAPYLE